MVLPLQSLCEVVIAIDICNDSELKEVIFGIPKNLLQNYLGDGNAEKRENFFKHLITEISNMIKHFPESLLEKILIHVPLVAIEMLQWAKFHEDKFCITFDFSKNFISSSIFTTKGVIDWERAARDLMEEKSLKPKTLFNIACFFSFPDFILQYWIEIRDNPVPFSFDEIYNKQDFEYIIKLWKSQLKVNNMQALNTKDSKFLLHALKASVESCSEVSVRYFWKQLNETGKDFAADFIAQTFHYKAKLGIVLKTNFDFFSFQKPYFNMIMFMYSELSNEKMKKILSIQEIAYLVLRNMLCWPYQSLFLNKAKDLLNIVLENEFFWLLLDIINKMDDKFVKKTFDYRYLFRMVWNNSSEQYKKNVFKRRKCNKPSCHCHFHKWKFKKVTFFYHLIFQYSIVDFTYEDKEIICLILESATEAEIKGILLKEAQIICIEMVKKGNLGFADLFLECIKVKNTENFKRNLLTHQKFNAALKEFLNNSKLNSIDNILKWIPSLKEVKNLKKFNLV